MYESYIKEIPIIDIKENEREQSIVKSILEAQKNLELAHRNFEYARGDLIDYYAYQIKSEQAKINYLLKQAKDQKIVLNIK
ncbi:MAG: DUF2508 family protein [Clostridia bacterium]|jgi:hypothetical protein|nr:DUF2508 family protein [Clostridia bacterium]